MYTKLYLRKKTAYFYLCSYHYFCRIGRRNKSKQLSGWPESCLNLFHQKNTFLLTKVHCRFLRSSSKQRRLLRRKLFREHKRLKQAFPKKHLQLQRWMLWLQYCIRHVNKCKASILKFEKRDVCKSWLHPKRIKSGRRKRKQIIDKGQGASGKLKVISLPEGKTRKYKRLKLISPIPKARISSGFGPRRSPFTHRKSFHNGLDYIVSFGRKIRAAASGRVWRSGWIGRSCGLGVIIGHRGHRSTCYCHMSQVLTIQRSYVRKGDVIGRVGSTGRSTGAHLHFGLRIRSHYQDPRHYMENPPKLRVRKRRKR